MRRATGLGGVSSRAYARWTPSASCSASFEDENVPGETDPLAALSVLELELVLADVSTLEQQLTKKRSRVAPLDPAIAAGLKAAPVGAEGSRAGHAALPFGAARDPTERR